MPQSSSNRGREEAKDTEDTGTYPGHTQLGTPVTEDPLPQQDRPGPIAEDTPIPSPLQLREEPRLAFLAHPMLPEPEELELSHISALLALLVDEEWSATVIRLIAKQVSKKKATAIWNSWTPYLAHPPPTRRGRAKLWRRCFASSTPHIHSPLSPWM